MRAILDSRFWILGIAVLAGCSAPYDVRLSDERSASNGALFFFGWCDPPLIPGTRLVDASPGSRVVLWNEAGLEAIVDLGDDGPVIVREENGARAPTDLELAVISAVFPDWPIAASPRPEAYAHDRRLERRFPSHIWSHFQGLAAPAAVEFALGDSPAGWLALGGRARAMIDVAGRAPLGDLARLIDGARALGPADRDMFFWALTERKDLTPENLVRVARAGAPVLASRHGAADESVCLAAIEEIAKEPLSTGRRDGLIAVLESPGVTPKVREKVLEVPLAYPEDREAVRAKAGK